MVRAAGAGGIIEGVLNFARDGVSFDSFLLEIQFDAIPPREQPRVFEIGGRIERNESHHVNGDGSLCVGVPEEVWLLLDGSYEPARFIEEAVTPFLLGIAYKLRGEKWPYGERSHGANGICEFYGEKFGTREPEHVIDVIDVLLSDAPKGHWACPCGSRKELRRCHRDSVNELRARRMPIAMLQRSANLVGHGLASSAEASVDDLKRLGVKMRRILAKRALPLK